MMAAKRIALTVLVATGLIGSGPSFAQEEPKRTGAAAVRESFMQAMGGHTGAVQKIVTEQPDLLSHVRVHADAVAAMSPVIPAMFPEGTGTGTDALPAVWSDAAGFEAASKRNGELATALSQAAQGGDPKATLAAFAALGKQGCGGCHQTFRVKKS